MIVVSAIPALIVLDLPEATPRLVQVGRPSLKHRGSLSSYIWGWLGAFALRTHPIMLTVCHAYLPPERSQYKSVRSSIVVLWIACVCYETRH